jgi:rubrerythrin
MSSDDVKPTFGQTVYDDEGNELGRIRGFDEHGFYVTLDEGIPGLSEEHIVAGHEFGQAELMWRCWECGEMDDLDDDLPEACPSCGAPKEDLYYWTED